MQWKCNDLTELNRLLYFIFVIDKSRLANMFIFSMLLQFWLLKVVLLILCIYIQKITSSKKSVLINIIKKFSDLKLTMAQPPVYQQPGYQQQPTVGYQQPGYPPQGYGPPPVVQQPHAMQPPMQAAGKSLFCDNKNNLKLYF